jgi:large repetitive protein
VNRSHCWRLFSIFLAIILTFPIPVSAWERSETVTINHGAPYTEDDEVLLTFQNVNEKAIQSVSFSHDGKTYTSAEPFLSKRPWKLTSDSGKKQVYVKFFTAGGGSSIASDSIVLRKARRASVIARHNTNEAEAFPEKNVQFFPKVLAQKARSAISDKMSSPKSLTPAPTRGALFGKDLTSSSESVGDPQPIDSRSVHSEMTEGVNGTVETPLPTETIPTDESTQTTPEPAASSSNESTSGSGSFHFGCERPLTGSITINNNDPSTSSQDVTLTLNVQGGVIQGDYNCNGTVDAADYTVWRDNLGFVGPHIADGDQDGTVNQGDYTFWKPRFGQTNGVTQMSFSNDNITFTAPEPFQTTKSWTLSSGNGTKTVYVKYLDAFGHESAVFADTIDLQIISVMVTYVYDDLNRLTGVYYQNGKQIEYDYDEVGNRTAFQSGNS